MSDSHLTRGLLDTSVVIDYEVIEGARLPDETAISAVTLAELAAGPHATRDELERSRRQDRLHWAASHWDPVCEEHLWVALFTGPCDRQAAQLAGEGYACPRRPAKMVCTIPGLLTDQTRDDLEPVP